MVVPKIIIKVIRVLLRNTWLNYANLSFSQNGEDILLAAMFSRQQRGFYVDIGAHHPYRFSNTYRFYRRGWRGINVDALPGTMALFNKRRPRDINIECGVSRELSTLTYHRFAEPAYNTCDLELARERRESHVSDFLETISIDAVPLTTIFNRYLPAGQAIDFLAIDVEGLDLEVLMSNDWSRYRPQVVVTEALKVSYDEMSNDPVMHFMRENEYRLTSKLHSSAFFVDVHSELGSWLMR